MKDKRAKDRELFTPIFFKIFSNNKIIGYVIYI